MFVLKSPDRLIVYVILVCISSEEAPASYWVGASLNQDGEWKWEDGTVFNITGKADKYCCFLHENKCSRKGRSLLSFSLSVFRHLNICKTVYLFVGAKKIAIAIAIKIKLEIVNFYNILNSISLT